VWDQVIELHPDVRRAKGPSEVPWVYGWLTEPEPKLELELEPEPKPVTLDLLSMSKDELVALADKVRSRLAELSPPLKPTQQIVTFSGPKKERILLIGLLPKQVEEISREFPQVEIRGWKDGSYKELIASAAGSDKLLCTRFVSHTISKMVMSQKCRSKVLLTPGEGGGITKIKAVLSQYCSN
jgi:hypothetical protein